MAVKGSTDCVWYTAFAQAGHKIFKKERLGCMPLQARTARPVVTSCANMPCQQAMSLLGDVWACCKGLGRVVVSSTLSHIPKQKRSHQYWSAGMTLNTPLLWIDAAIWEISACVTRCLAMMSPPTMFMRCCLSQLCLCHAGWRQLPLAASLRQSASDHGWRGARVIGQPSIGSVNMKTTLMANRSKPAPKTSTKLMLLLSLGTHTSWDLNSDACPCAMNAILDKHYLL